MKPDDRIRKQLDELRRARGDLAHAAADVRQLKEDLSPRVVMGRSVRKHPWRWAAGGVVAGWVLLRLLVPGKGRSRSKKTFTKGSLVGMIIGSMGTVLRIPAEEFARQRLRAYLNQVMPATPAESHPEPEDPAPDRRP